MLKVLIVDDEPLVRMGIKSLLVQCSTDVEVVADVSNGLKAIKVMEAQKVDLLFTDIKMPEMDGLDLIRYIQKNNLKIKIVVLSCYNDFELVREAFTCGVYDYILKYDIDVQSIENIVCKFIAEAESTSEEKTSGSKDYLKQNLLKGLFSGESVMDAQQIKKQFEMLDICLKSDGLFSVVCMDIAYEQGLFHEPVEKSALKTEEGIKNVIGEFFKSIPLEMYPETKTRYIVCLGLPDSMEMSILIGRFEQFKSVFQKYFHVSISIGISSRGGACDLKRLYVEAVSTADNRFYYGNGMIAAFAAMDEVQKDVYEKLNERKVKMIQAIGEENFPEIIAQLQLLKTDLKASLIPPAEAKWTFLSLLEIIKIQFHCELQHDEELVEQINPDVLALGNLDEMNDYIIAILKGISRDRIGSVAQRDYSTGVRKCIEFINEHYSDETLNLACLSNTFCYSIGYLSRIFKKETEKPIVDYINEVRIGNAKRLLKNQKNKVYQVAENVGYANYSYFSKMFKKITGLSPSKYQEQQRLK